MEEMENGLPRPKVKFSTVAKSGPQIREIATLNQRVRLVDVRTSASETPVQAAAVSDDEAIVPPLRQASKVSRDIEQLERKLAELSMSRTPRKSILKPRNGPDVPQRPAQVAEPSHQKENDEKRAVRIAEPRKTPRRPQRTPRKVEKRADPCADVSRKSTTAARTPAATGHRKIGLMPCHRAKKPAESGRTRVDVMRNVSRPVSKVLVAPGVPRHRDQDVVSCSAVVEGRKRVDVVSADKLDRPEYNSTVCTIRKLEEVKRRPVVGDVESLPSVYRDLISGRISSALDFPPTESIFHDLVDISVDEKQLPVPVTRSRDPEPRPKDFVPSLADFFTPQYAKEYAVGVVPRPRTPEVTDNWSGFKVSQRINSWRMARDES